MNGHALDTESKAAEFLESETLRYALTFVVASFCLAFSALYELFEWRVAVALGPRAADFLGTQGDIWDTQEDMATCLLGAILAVLLLSKLHDRYLEKLAQPRVA